jgi:hypothetical protein
MHAVSHIVSVSVRYYKIMIICFGLLLLGCSGARPPIVEEPITDIEPAPYLHIVTSNRETLGLIAEWYTGSFNNWKAISRYNEKGESSIVRLGESIFIPHHLLIREDPLKLHPQTRSGKSRQESAAPPVRDTDREKVTSTSSEESVQVSAPSSEQAHEKSEPAQKEYTEGTDLDELSEMVDMFDDEISEGQSAPSEPPEVIEQPETEADNFESENATEGPPDVLESKEDSLSRSGSLEIDDKERRRMELLQELLKK